MRHVGVFALSLFLGLAVLCPATTGRASAPVLKAKIVKKIPEKSPKTLRGGRVSPAEIVLSTPVAEPTVLAAAPSAEPDYTPRPKRGDDAHFSGPDIPKPKTPTPKPPRGIKPLAAFPDKVKPKSPPAGAFTPHPPRLTAGTPKRSPGLNEYISTYGETDQDSKYFTNGLSSSRSVALTFDDGPNSKHTPRLLQLLREAKVPATFFVLGENIKSREALLIEMAQFGFEIGNHSWNHPNFSKASEQSIKLQLMNTNAAIEQVTGQKVTLARLPYGAGSKTAVSVCDELGLKIIQWSVDTEDWKSGMTAEKRFQKVKELVKGGSIILMHDGQAQSGPTVDAVPQIIEYVRSQGLEFVTVSELIRETQAPPPTPDPAVTAAPALATPRPSE